MPRVDVEGVMREEGKRVGRKEGVEEGAGEKESIGEEEIVW